MRQRSVVLLLVFHAVVSTGRSPIRTIPYTVPTRWHDFASEGNLSERRGRLSVSPSVSPCHDRRQSNPGKSGDRPARIPVYPDRNPHNSDAAREEVTIDSFERPTVASIGSMIKVQWLVGRR